MKKTLLALSIALVATAATAAQVVEAIVIRVGDRIVTRTQYEKRLREGLNEIDQTVPAAQQAAKKAEYRKGLTEDIISELLVKDRADRLGLTVTDPEIKEAVARLKEQYGIRTDQQFDESLKQSGMTRADMEARLRDTILTNKVFSKELRGREDMTDKELRERYDREKEHYRLPERAHLRAIIVTRPDDPAAAAKAEQRVNQIAQDARVAPDFAKYAASVPENAMKEKGGDMGEVARGELLPDLDKAVFNAQSGDIIGPIATKSGWHILKVEQRLPSEIPAFESVKDKLRKDVTDETFQRDYKVYIERLRKDAYIEIHDKNLPTA
ncbi:MAG TPA: peptidyl-prolyl cis-trans isomerase [Thermoanaerobaculia bacterium]|nr:peptidyl-prolyl cis-trans isomerase [Thermoanaerobaculia bacterium]